MFEVRRVPSDNWRVVREIRLAALKDTPDWFRATYDEEVDQSEEWWRGFIEAGAWFIGYERDVPVGIAAAIRDAELEESDRRLISMWVVPAARNRGIGAELVNAATDWAREDGAKEPQLEVTETNDAAMRLYERCGFRATGRVTAHPRKLTLVEHEMRLRP